MFVLVVQTIYEASKVISMVCMCVCILKLAGTFDIFFS